MAAAVDYESASRGDRFWGEALAQLAAEGVIGGEQAAVLVERHRQIEEAERERNRRTALIELAGYVGAALTVGGVVAIFGQIVDDLSDSAQLLLIGVLAGALLGSAALIARFTPGGVGALRSPAQAARRRLVGVIGVSGAGLTSATVVLLLQEVVTASAQDNWNWLPALSGLVISVAVYRVAPGVAPTLGVGGFLAATTLLVMDAFGWLDLPGVGQLGILLLAAFGALLLARILKPAILIEAICIAAWLITSIPLLSAEPGFGISETEAAMQLWMGRIALLALVAIGGWMFTHDGTWPWAIGVALGAAALVGFTFAEALGGAIAMTIAGIALILISVLRLRASHAGRTPHPSPPAATA